jgi:tetratricopeptide (TPR) repeat protein
MAAFRKRSDDRSSETDGFFNDGDGTWLAPPAAGFAAITLQLAKSRAYICCDPLMRLSFAVCCALTAAAFASPSYADARSDAKAQVDFGINVAQRGLWREAIYRWEKAVQIDPTYAAALNDLAVAYEHEGQLAKAREAYEKALALDPNNAQIKQNYDLFKEINDRTSVKKETP